MRRKVLFHNLKAAHELTAGHTAQVRTSLEPANPSPKIIWNILDKIMNMWHTTRENARKIIFLAHCLFALCALLIVSYFGFFMLGFACWFQ